MAADNQNVNFAALPTVPELIRVTVAGTILLLSASAHGSGTCIDDHLQMVVPGYDFTPAVKISPLKRPFLSREKITYQEGKAAIEANLAALKELAEARALR